MGWLLHARRRPPGLAAVRSRPNVVVGGFHPAVLGVGKGERDDVAGQSGSLPMNSDVDEVATRILRMQKRSATTSDPDLEPSRGYYAQPPSRIDSGLIDSGLKHGNALPGLTAVERALQVARSSNLPGASVARCDQIREVRDIRGTGAISVSGVCAIGSHRRH